MTTHIQCNTAGCTLFNGSNTKIIDLVRKLGQHGSRLGYVLDYYDLRYFSNGEPDMRALRRLEEDEAMFAVRVHQEAAMIKFHDEIIGGNPTMDAEDAGIHTSHEGGHDLVVSVWETPDRDDYLSPEQVLLRPELMKPPIRER